MKKRIIIVGVIITILVIIILKHKDIYKDYKINQIKKDFVNILNGKFSKSTDEDTIKDYKRIHKKLNELNHNNITELIELYINNVISGMNIYIQNNEKVVVNKDAESGKINEYRDVEIGKDIYMTYYTVDYAVTDSFTSNDVKNYKDGIFTDLLIEKLKECLDYEEIDGKINWFINSIEDKIIELPYNCYIDYKAYHREDNKEFKRAVDVVFDKDFELQNNLDDIIVKYETKNGNIKERKSLLFYGNVNKKDYYDLNIFDILTNGTDTVARAELNSHTLERWKYEADVAFFEEYPIWKHEDEEMDILDRIIESREAEENKEE